MNRAVLHLAALALPLAGLGALWFATDRASREGSEWEVPVQGYDPRDLLQGHYVQFQYDWPDRKSPTIVEFDGPASGTSNAAYCLEGKPPHIDRLRLKGGDADTCPAFVRMDQSFSSGRLYVSQNQARQLQTALANPKLQGVVRIRVRSDGHITPLRMSFRPLPPATGPSDRAP